MKTSSILLGIGALSLLFAVAATTVTLTATRGDLDDNARGDLITRDDASGVMTLHSMNGYTVLAQTNLFSGQSVGMFTLAATSDLDGDAIEDLILDYEGLHYIVFMGTNAPLEILLGANMSPWHVVAGGDLNGDNYGDIVIKYSDQNIYAAGFMQGTNIVGASYIWDGGDISPWNVVGAGDFDGDGKADIVIQDGSSSTYGIVFMDGATMLDAKYVTVGELTDLTPFKVTAVTDLDGNGKSDLVITSEHDGSQFCLFMNGGNAENGDYINGTATNTLTGRIVGPR